MNRLNTLLFSAILISNVSAEELTDIQISSPVMDKATISNEAIEEVDTRNAVDGGDLLKNINGVNAIRRGGHGLDPVIRGQSDQRLNTFLDLAFDDNGARISDNIVPTPSKKACRFCEFRKTEYCSEGI